MGSEIVRVPEDGVDLAWPVLLPLLRKALDLPRGRQIVDEVEVYRACREGRAQLWAIYIGKEDRYSQQAQLVGSLVTQIQLYPTGVRVARIQICGGAQMEKWLHLLSEIEAWAAEEKCSSIEVTGRRGWKRVLAPLGYHEVETVIGKEL